MYATPNAFIFRVTVPGICIEVGKELNLWGF